MHELSGIELIRQQRIDANKARCQQLITQTAADIMAPDAVPVAQDGSPPALPTPTLTTPPRHASLESAVTLESAPEHDSSQDMSQALGYTATMLALQAAGCQGGSCLPGTSGLRVEDLANVLASPAGGRATRQKTGLGCLGTPPPHKRSRSAAGSSWY